MPTDCPGGPGTNCIFDTHIPFFLSITTLNWHVSIIRIFFRVLFLKKYIFINFLQRGRERDSKKHRSAASCTAPTGDVPTTKAHALDQNQTWDPSVRRLTLYLLSQADLGRILFLDHYLDFLSKEPLKD
uniref:Uncharacterized protein n=1 Tax=Pipistrellus kuhlii TaxID=59472 RepID=A0A7J7UGC6_PIPKU|nr:hypothetical protein mPipKuh1_009124 [Pipistrellus kuhlii]